MYYDSHPIHTTKLLLEPLHSCKYINYVIQKVHPEPWLYFKRVKPSYKNFIESVCGAIAKKSPTKASPIKKAITSPVKLQKPNFY